MSLEYIRNYYGVPAHRGREIVYTGSGKEETGIIVGSTGSYLIFRTPERKRDIALHPTWEVDYGN